MSIEILASIESRLGNVEVVLAIQARVTNDLVLCLNESQNAILLLNQEIEAVRNEILRMHAMIELLRHQIGLDNIKIN